MRGRAALASRPHKALALRIKKENKRKSDPHRHRRHWSHLPEHCTDLEASESDDEGGEGVRRLALLQLANVECNEAAHEHESKYDEEREEERAKRAALLAAHHTRTNAHFDRESAVLARARTTERRARSSSSRSGHT